MDEKSNSKFVNIYIVCREPKQLDEEYTEANFSRKVVKVSKNTQSVQHLISIFEKLSKEEFKVKETFSKHMNLESLFYWANLSEDQRIKLMEDLFLDFIRNGLYGRSKESTKLILLIDLTPLNFGIALIQTTITGKEIKVVKTREGELLKEDERFLDEDNIYRFVYFYTKEDNKNNIYFRTYQKSLSQHFMRWLQIEEEKLFDITQELDFSFSCLYENLVIQINISEDFLINVIDNPHSDINLNVDENSLVIDKIRFKIHKIRIRGAKKEFKSLIKLLDFLRKRKCNLDIIERKYNKAIKILENSKDTSVAPLIAHSNEDEADFVEDEDTVIIGNIKINKKVAELPDSRILLILSNKPSVLYKSDFLDKICSDIKNEKIIRIMTVHLPIITDPNKTREIGPIIFYNELPQLSTELLILAKFYKKKLKSLSPILRYILVAVILDYLSKEVKPLTFFFKQLLRRYLQLQYPFLGAVFYLENRLIEYKRPEVFYGDREKVINRLYKEIIKKLKDQIIIFVIGIDGKARKICPIDTGKINDDICRDILNEVENKLKSDDIILSEPFFIPIKSDNVLLVFYAKKAQHNETEESIFPDGW